MLKTISILLLFLGIAGLAFVLLDQPVIAESEDNSQEASYAEALARKTNCEELSRELSELKKQEEQKSALLKQLIQSNAFDSRTIALKASRPETPPIVQTAPVAMPRDLSLSETAELYGKAVRQAGFGTARSGFTFALKNQIVVVSVETPLEHSQGRGPTGHRIFTDEKTGLVFLKFQTSTPTSGVSPAQWIASHVAPAKLGDQIYVVDYAGRARTSAILPPNTSEGSISAVDRYLFGARYIQTTLPSTLDLCGAPVFNAQGQLAGVFVAGVPGMERTAFAISSTDFLEAVARCENYLRTGTSVSTGYIKDSKSIDAARLHTVPPGIQSVECEPPQAGGRQIFAGPNNKVIVCDRASRTTTSYVIGSTYPEWTYTDVSDYRLFFNPGGEWAYLLRPADPAAILDLQSGKIVRELPVPLPEYIVRRCYAFGPDYLITASVSFCFLDGRSGERSKIGVFEGSVFGRDGDTFYFCTAEGNLGRFDADSLNRQLKAKSTAQPQQRRVRVGNREYTVTTKRNPFADLKDVTDQVDSYQANGLSFRPEDIGNCFAIPNTERVLICSQIWEVKENGVRKIGDLPSVRHSDGDERWFGGFYTFPEKDVAPVNAGYAVSSDGAYTITQTHVVDLNNLQAVSELPIPSANCGFLSGGKHIYLYDKVNKKIIWYRLSDLKKVNGETGAK